MRKITALLLAGMMMFSLTACSNNSSNVNSEPETNTGESTSSSENTVETVENTASTESSEETVEDTTSTDVNETQEMENEDTGSNILVAYFSRAGENYNVGVIEKGNTAIIAEMIGTYTGGDLFQIETVNPYPESYDECTEVAQQEQRDNARPELTGTVENFENYDVVFLGYPNWWGDMPMAVYTFLESYDFSGKTIVPFATHEGSGLSSTERSIADTCAGAEVLDGLAIRGSVAQNSQEEAQEEVTNWLREVGFINE